MIRGWCVQTCQPLFSFTYCKSRRSPAALSSPKSDGLVFTVASSRTSTRPAHATGVAPRIFGSRQNLHENMLIYRNLSICLVNEFEMAALWSLFAISRIWVRQGVCHERIAVPARHPGRLVCSQCLGAAAVWYSDLNVRKLCGVSALRRQAVRIHRGHSPVAGSRGRIARR